MSRAPSAFAPDVPQSTARAIPIATIMVGSLIPIIPMIASYPVLPPLGLIVLLAWRLVRPETVPLWSPLAFGAFDDLVSGQPLGCAMLFWTVSFLVIDLLEQRLVVRDFWLDWLLAAGGISLSLIAGRLLATPLAAHVDTLLLLQVVVAVLLYPFVARLVAWFDRKRGRA